MTSSVSCDSSIQLSAGHYIESGRAVSQENHTCSECGGLYFLTNPGAYHIRDGRACGPVGVRR